MPTSKRCSKCGAELAEGVMNGLCPVCVGRLALGDEATSTTEAVGPLVSEATSAFPTHIGGYKLLEQIGEGGCGVVYVAEQEKPVRRRVALKVIKLGMETKQVIARF